MMMMMVMMMAAAMANFQSMHSISYCFYNNTEIDCVWGDIFLPHLFCYFRNLSNDVNVATTTFRARTNRK